MIYVKCDKIEDYRDFMLNYARKERETALSRSMKAKTLKERRFYEGRSGAMSNMVDYLERVVINPDFGEHGPKGVSVGYDYTSKTE